MRLNVKQSVRDCEGRPLMVNQTNAHRSPVIGQDHRPVQVPESLRSTTFVLTLNNKAQTEPIRGRSRRAAKRYRSVVLVKGVTSQVVCPEGGVWTYDGGAPGLGVSGSGDVLAGIVGGLLARGAEPLNALLWAVWLHGEAGVALAKKVGPIGFLAREIADEIPALLPR